MASGRLLGYHRGPAGILFKGTNGFRWCRRSSEINSYECRAGRDARHRATETFARSNGDEGDARRGRASPEDSAVTMPTRIAIRMLLSEIESVAANISRSERALASGTDFEKVRASADLAELRPRANELRRKLAKLEKSAATVAEDLRVGLGIELRHLTEAFERWLEPR